MQLRTLRPTRRPHRLTLLAAGALLASPMLGGCGFDYATDRVNTISAGINDRSGTVDVLGMLIIAGQDDAGLVVGTLVNKDLDNAITLEGVQQTAEITPVDTDPVEVAANGTTSLFRTGGLPITGSFKAGDFVPVTLTFDNGQTTTVNINVFPPCHSFALENYPELTLPEPPAADDPGTTEEITAETERYSCEVIPDVEHGGGEGEGGTEGEEPSDGAEVPGVGTGE